jgi:hypothetical protein
MNEVGTLPVFSLFGIWKLDAQTELVSRRDKQMHRNVWRARHI